MTDDSQPQVEDWFWDLIESSGRSLRTLAGKLEQLPNEQLRQYRLQYDEAKDWVSPHSAEEFWPYVTDCSEDRADDFAAWVVGRGREFFDRVRSNPEAVQQHLDVFEVVRMGRGAAGAEWDIAVDRDDYRGYQRPDAIVISIYETRFGEDLLDACYDQRGHPRSEV
jgi:hypothetical protein